MGDTARSDSQSVICLPILKVNMQIPVPTAARGIAKMPVCGPFSVSTGQNYFRKLSSGANIFLTFPLPCCECECSMSSPELPKGIMSVAVSILFPCSVFAVCDATNKNEGRKSGVRETKKYQ